MAAGYQSVSGADVKYGMVLALRGAPLRDQGIRLITGGLTAVPSFSERGIRFIQGVVCVWGKEGRCWWLK